MRNFQTVFQSSYAILHFYPQWRRVLISCQHLWLSEFLIIPILVNVKWYLMALMCISLIANDVKYLFMCIWANCISSLVKCLVKYFAFFLIEFSYHWIIRVLNIFWIKVLNKMWFANIFSQPVTCLPFLTDVFWNDHVFNFNEIQFIMNCAFSAVYLCLPWGHKDFSPDVFWKFYSFAS